MARLPRVVIADVAHHVTQRGNARQIIFANDADRLVYLELLREHCQLYPLALLGYCLMSNHVHLVVVPHTSDALAQCLKQAHGRYASYWNARQSSSGHVWQGRFYSCPLDDSHLWKALRYVELNPVRAGMVTAPELWKWSSATAHCGLPETDLLLQMAPWRKRWTAPEWRDYLSVAETSEEIRILRQFTHTGRRSEVGSSWLRSKSEPVGPWLLESQVAQNKLQLTLASPRLRSLPSLSPKMGNISSVPGFPPRFPPVSNS